MSTMHFAHLNVARLRHPPGDPRVAEFVDNVPKVNALADRSPGFVWRLDDRSAQVNPDRAYQALWGDPKLAVTLSVWESMDALMHFVVRTVHGAFLRRRSEWFEPYGAPNYVVWKISADSIPTLEEASQKLDYLHQNGAGPDAFDFDWYQSNTTQ